MARYDSGTGWLSFWAPIDGDTVLERIDPNDIKRDEKDQSKWRVEVVDRTSKTHLGHIFSDGPTPTGKRYRVNAAGLRFVPGPAPSGDAKEALKGWTFKKE